jgi:hypothetical protein
MTSAFARARNGFLSCGLTILVCALASQAWAGQTVGYRYQTHQTRQPLSGPRDQHLAMKLGNGKIGIFGGFGILSVELFDPAAEVFTTSSASRWFANFSGVALMDGSALLVDGEHDCTYDYVKDLYVNTVNTYSEGFIRWAVPVLLPEGKVFFCGGCDIDFNFVDKCVIYDPRTRRFTSCGHLQVARSSHTAVLLDEQHVLVAGGYQSHVDSGMPVNLDSLEIFDLQSGTSALVRTPMREARYEHCSAKLPDGRALILGGICWPTDLTIRSTEIFDPRTAAIVDGPMLALGRRGARIVTMPSGRIAVFGGQYDGRAIEVYDPNTNSFSLADCLMCDPRWTDFTATSLDSGAVLLAGGRVNVTDETLQNAEVFEEIPTTVESHPPLDAVVIRQLLADPNQAVVDETAAWLAEVGPPAKPILESLLNDESPTVRLVAGSILQTISERESNQRWCVEIWNSDKLVGTVWMEDYSCPDSFYPTMPGEPYDTIMRSIQAASYTRLVVRFAAYTPYESRAKLFNCVGWTRAANVVLGDDWDVSPR